MTQPEFDWEPRKHARHSDPDTSHQAAQNLKNPSAKMLQVFCLLLGGPKTHDQLGHASGLGDSARKRCKDLVHRGWVKNSGLKGLSDRGQPSIIWEVTPFGIKTYETSTPPYPHR